MHGFRLLNTHKLYARCRRHRMDGAGDDYIPSLLWAGVKKLLFRQNLQNRNHLVSMDCSSHANGLCHTKIKSFEPVKNLLVVVSKHVFFYCDYSDLPCRSDIHLNYYIHLTSIQ